MARSAMLERLILGYEGAIDGTSIGEIEKFSRLVEEEANRIDYQNHRRLYALHTRAEAACDRLSGLVRI